jgi:hypothetical protein
MMLVPIVVEYAVGYARQKLAHDVHTGIACHVNSEIYSAVTG